MRHLAIGCLLVIGGALLRPGAGPLHAQSAEDIFNDTTLQDVRLSINSRDLLKLRLGYLTNTYYPADLQWGGTRVRNVGVRSRGGGSRNPSKLGLRVDFNRYTKNQQFAGLRSLILDNGWQDASLLREALAMSLFRRMGEPAPREAFCRLFINNVYAGLYTVVESVDGAFAGRAFADPDGYLYEYQYAAPFYGEYLGDALAPYKLRFQPQTHEREDDSTLFEPLRDLFRDLNDPDDAVWREHVEARLDLAQVIRQFAIESFLGENDALLGYAGMNNFYAYKGASTHQFRLVPWDRDHAFTFAESSVLRGLADNVITARAIAHDDLRALYLDTIAAAAATAAQDNWLLTDVNRLASLITAAAYADTRKQFSNAEFDAAIEFLRAFAATRPAFVTTEISTLR